MLIVFNLFALMQMFNYFNCRKLRPDQINIFAGIRIINVTIFVAIVALQAAFITFGGSNFAFYPNGLSIQHWAFCAGTGMVVWVVGFAIKLVPVRQ